MPCDTRLKQGQSIKARAEEVRLAVARLQSGIINQRIQVKVGSQGAVAFVGWADQDRDGVTDACAYRRLMVTATPLTRAAIARAEALAGRQVDRVAVAQGQHSHDGGQTWHGKG